MNSVIIHRDSYSCAFKSPSLAAFLSELAYRTYDFPELGGVIGLLPRNYFALNRGYLLYYHPSPGSSSSTVCSLSSVLSYFANLNRHFLNWRNSRHLRTPLMRLGTTWLAGNPILEPTTCFPTAETASKRGVRSRQVGLFF